MDVETALKTNVFTRAKIFIEGIGSFAPFGAKVVSDEIIDVVFDIDEDAEFIAVDGLEYKVSANDNAFDSKVLIEILTSNFSSRIKNQDCQAAAIAYDVATDIKNADGASEKRDALCLKISSDGENWSEEYFPYMIIDGQCVWR